MGQLIEKCQEGHFSVILGGFMEFFGDLLRRLEILEKLRLFPCFFNFQRNNLRHELYLRPRISRKSDKIAPTTFYCIFVRKKVIPTVLFEN